MTTIRSILPLLGVALTYSLVPSAEAAVLHDSRFIIGNGPSATRWSMIGGSAVYGSPQDSQTADDFTVANPVELTSITADFWHSSPLSSPAGGWLVEVFSDAGGKPSEIPAHAVNSSVFLRIGTFAQGAGPSGTSDNRSTFQIDLAGLDVTLGAGTWWVSVVAVDETPFGARYNWAGSNAGVFSGNVAHRRAGGIVHGNGYPAPDNTPSVWSTLLAATPNTARPYELSMRIEGNIIPAPAATALLSLCGLTTALNRRRRG